MTTQNSTTLTEAASRYNQVACKLTGADYSAVQMTRRAVQAASRIDSKDNVAGRILAYDSARLVGEALLEERAAKASAPAEHDGETCQVSYCVEC